MADAKSVWSVFQTSPGRIDPRTGRLVQLTSTPVTRDWERETARPGLRREREEDFRGRPWGRRDMYPQSRPGYAEMMAGSLGKSGDSSVLGTLLPWLFVAGVAIIAIEASGLIRPTKQV